MDTDDLTDAAYEIILKARAVNGLLAAELAISGKDATSEREFLQCMIETLAAAREDAGEYLDYDEDDPRSVKALEDSIRRLERAVKSLMD
jgi:hypothetical protein